MSRELATVSFGSMSTLDHLQRLDLVLIGARGKVGSTFRHQLGRQQTSLRAEFNLDVRLIATFDRRGFAFDVQGLVPETVEALIPLRGEGDVEKLFVHITRPGPAQRVRW